MKYLKKLYLLIFIIFNCKSGLQAQGIWIQKTSFAGAARQTSVGFSIGSKGYIGSGFDANQSGYNDFYEYDPLTNSWTQKANIGTIGRAEAVGFSIGNKGYIGTG